MKRPKIIENLMKTQIEFNQSNLLNETTKMTNI